MGIHESIAAASLTLALAIPVFMEKVMRPRYEERFEAFKAQNLKSFLDLFEKLSRKIKPNDEDLIDNISEEMNQLSEAWGNLTSNEIRMTQLLSQRVTLFSLWIITLLLNMISVEYNIIIIEVIKIGHISFAFFIGMLIKSTFYVNALFKLDSELSKIKIKKDAEINTTEKIKQTIISGKKSYDNLLALVTNEIGKYTIFQKDVVVRQEGGTIELDVVIPNSDAPEFVIEIKRNAMLTGLQALSFRFNILKERYSNLKTILVYENISERALHFANTNFDEVIQIDSINMLKKLLRK